MDGFSESYRKAMDKVELSPECVDRILHEARSSVGACEAEVGRPGDGLERRRPPETAFLVAAFLIACCIGVGAITVFGGMNSNGNSFVLKISEAYADERAQIGLESPIGAITMRGWGAGDVFSANSESDAGTEMRSVGSYLIDLDCIGSNIASIEYKLESDGSLIVQEDGDNGVEDLYGKGYAWFAMQDDSYMTKGPRTSTSFIVISEDSSTVEAKRTIEISLPLPMDAPRVSDDSSSELIRSNILALEGIRIVAKATYLDETNDEKTYRIVIQQSDEHASNADDYVDHLRFSVEEV